MSKDETRSISMGNAFGIRKFGGSWKEKCRKGRKQSNSSQEEDVNNKDVALPAKNAVIKQPGKKFVYQIYLVNISSHHIIKHVLFYLQILKITGCRNQSLKRSTDQVSKNQTVKKDPF